MKKNQDKQTMFTLKLVIQIYPIKINQLRSFIDLEILILNVAKHVCIFAKLNNALSKNKTKVTHAAQFKMNLSKRVHPHTPSQMVMSRVQFQREDQ